MSYIQSQRISIVLEEIVYISSVLLIEETNAQRGDDSQKGLIVWEGLVKVLLNLVCVFPITSPCL